MTVETVSRIAIGGDVPEGANSAYLVDDRVIVDPGPPTDHAWHTLQNGLDRADVDRLDIEYVLVTHWHADHAGLAPRLAEEADATLAMGADDAPLIGDYAGARERRLERDGSVMRRLGVPERIVANVIANDTVSAIPDRTPVERLRDGETVAGLDVVATPGHTLGHTAFAGDGFLLVGDAILPTTTPNVGGSDTRTLQPEVSGSPSVRGGDDRLIDRDPLAAFRTTLNRLANRPERLLPGHGATVEPARVSEILDHHRARSRRVFEALEARKQATPWDIACDLFGDLEGIHVKFGAGEAAAHLQALEREGRVERATNDPVRYGLTVTRS
ncbi:MBL fold metallo-hydrolase [Natrinema halophilum]|uniref:MBL fold metallo-hydrolase n=1 Tax=Natrinema halophilum TaxID=1699371 RepID=A0A7D5GFN2_9EURY|nr:MBL fold metallo-hydrolase [Natrinema halophilum]QLG47728.1 MBL fold metallo-hydrolase [Natrinema halophilum]